MSVQPAVVDSSGWIEMFTDGPHAGPFLEVLDAESTLVVPAISILKVLKWVLREHSEAQALQAVAAMQRGQVVNLNSSLAIAAAQLIHNLWLPMADNCTVGLPTSSSTTKRKPNPAATTRSAWLSPSALRYARKAAPQIGRSVDRCRNHGHLKLTDRELLCILALVSG